MSSQPVFMARCACHSSHHVLVVDSFDDGTDIHLSLPACDLSLMDRVRAAARFVRGRHWLVDAEFMSHPNDVRALGEALVAIADEVANRGDHTDLGS